MTTTNKVLVQSKYIENAVTTQYTATNVTALIDLCEVTNQAVGAVTASIYLVTSGDSASDINRFLVTKSIQPGETYLCPEIRGTLENGDFIAAVASAASSLSLRICGREVT